MKNKIAVLQMNSGKEVALNLQQAEKLIAQAAQAGAELIVLPEMFSIMGATAADKVAVREPFGSGPVQDFLAQQALKYKLWIVGGTIPIATRHDPQRVRAACLVFDSAGETVARYDKIHLFDALVGAQYYQESETTEPGNMAVVVETPLGKLGLVVCYDLRFPELAQSLVEKGAKIIAVPTAFTQVTGLAHWEILIRATAIQTQCYIAASCQTGTHPSGRQTFGDSMIIDPWGVIIDRLKAGIGCVTAAVDLQQLQQIRQDLPVCQHHRLYN